MQNLPVNREYLKKLQESATKEEKESWKKRGASPQEGIYEYKKKLCLPWAHGAAHLSKTLMNALIDKYYVAPGITPMTSNFCKLCTICAKCNPGCVEKPPQKYLARPCFHCYVS
ncbi:hypothetical protein FKM82_025005 [Ascaphus truei]